MSENNHIPSNAEKSKAEEVTRHERFYFDDHIVLRVENILYRVPRYFFQRDSEFFAQMFTLPGKQQDGSSDGHPIRLEDQEPKDLEAFLSLLYPETSQEERTVEEWLSCWRFAHKWQFGAQQELAKKKLAAIASPVDKIILGRLFQEMDEWLVEAFIDMARRREPPTLPEGRRLGVDDLVFIGELRHGFKNLQFPNDARGFVKAALARPDMVMHMNGPRSQDTESQCWH